MDTGAEVEADARICPAVVEVARGTRQERQRACVGAQLRNSTHRQHRDAIVRGLDRNARCLSAHGLAELRLQGYLVQDSSFCAIEERPMMHEAVTEVTALVVRSG